MKIGQVRMAPRTPVKERFAKLMFDTDWGPLIVWGMTVLAFFATLVLSPLLPYVGIVIAGVVLVAVVVATLLAVAAFFNALRRRMWMRAFGQFLLGIIAVPVFVVGFLFSAFASAIVAGAVACAVDAVFPDRASVKDDSGSLGFKVEFKRAHPFLAEYHRAIRFPSGKRIGIGMDTGARGHSRSIGSNLANTISLTGSTSTPTATTTASTSPTRPWKSRSKTAPSGP